MRENLTDLRIAESIYCVLRSYFLNQKGATPTMSHNQFRALNDNEFHMLEKLGGIENVTGDVGHIPPSIEWDRLQVSYETFSGGFTICLVRHYSREYSVSFIWRGVSRCVREDRPNRARGEALAFKRAILYSYPVEI